MQEVKPGQLWTWNRPDGKPRTMLVQAVKWQMNAIRAIGINPQSGRRLQCVASFLARGDAGARLISFDPTFEYRPQPR